MYHFIILILTLSIFQSTLTAQNNENPRIITKDDYKPTNRTETGWFLSLTGGPCFSSSYFEVGDDLLQIYNIESSSFNSALSYHFQGDINYFFTENLGVGLGIGYGTYNLSTRISEIGSLKGPFGTDSEFINRVFIGENIVESIDFNSTNLNLSIHYKQPILEYLFIYGNLNGGVSYFSNNSSFSRSASSIIYQLEMSGYILEGLIPRTSAEAEYLENYQLFDESQSNSVQVKDTNALSSFGLAVGANLGVMASLNEKLRVKLGGLFRLSGNILDENTLTSPSESLITVVSRGETVENIYTPLLNRQGNQIKLSSIGLEMGIVYKL